MKSGAAVLAEWFHSLWKNECARLTSPGEGSYGSSRVNHFRGSQANKGEVDMP